MSGIEFGIPLVSMLAAVGSTVWAGFSWREARKSARESSTSAERAHEVALSTVAALEGANEIHLAKVERAALKERMEIAREVRRWAFSAMQASVRPEAADARWESLSETLWSTPEPGADTLEMALSDAWLEYRFAMLDQAAFLTFARETTRLVDTWVSDPTALDEAVRDQARLEELQRRIEEHE